MLDTSQFIKKRAHSFKVYCMCSTLTLRISHSFMQSTSNNSKSTHAGSKMESTHNFSFGVFFFCVFVIIITTDTTITTTNNNNKKKNKALIIRIAGSCDVDTTLNHIF